MKKAMIGLTAGTMLVGGVAIAQNATERPAPEQRGPKMDADGDGVITRAEAQASAAAMFARMDVNKDGKIDSADREARQQQRREEMFARLDTDKDGSISKAEFMADKGPRGMRGPGMEGPDGPPPPGAPGMDGPEMDGPPPPPPADGQPGKRGPHGGKHHRGMGHGGPRGGMMMMGDANKDGAITQAEFTAAAMKHFDMMDANKDGKVTTEERKAAHQKMKAEWKAKKGERKAPPAPAPAQ